MGKAIMMNIIVFEDGDKYATISTSDTKYMIPRLKAMIEFCPSKMNVLMMGKDYLQVEVPRSWIMLPTPAID